MIAPMVYRAASRLMFFPYGGLGRIRQQALDALALRAGQKVLEIGCGPGDLTAALTESGATVHAVDQSPAMLRAAAKRAPAAHFEQIDAIRFRPEKSFDVVLLAFVLHELPAGSIGEVVARMAGSLNESGRLVVLDHAVPSGATGRSWPRMLRMIEGSKINEWLRIDLASSVREAGLKLTLDEALAGGRARLLRGSR